MNRKVISLIARKNYWERKKERLRDNFLAIDWYMKWSIVVFFLPSVLWLIDKEKDTFFRVFASIGMLFFVLIFLTGLLRTLSDYLYKLPKYQRKINEINRSIIKETESELYNF